MVIAFAAGLASFARLFNITGAPGSIRSKKGYDVHTKIGAAQDRRAPPKRQMVQDRLIALSSSDLEWTEHHIPAKR